MKTILLVGIPGCGKSSILREIIQQIPAIHVVNYGDKMLEEAALEGLTRDRLRKLPIPEQQKIGIQAARKMVHPDGRITIVDTHALIRTPIGFCPGLPHEVLEILKPRACAWVECSPSMILQRRLADPSRSRDLESEEDLAMHQELTRSFLSACCMYTNAVLCCIPNNSPSITQNVLPLVRLIHSLSEIHDKKTILS